VTPRFVEVLLGVMWSVSGNGVDGCRRGVTQRDEIFECSFAAVGGGVNAAR